MKVGINGKLFNLARKTPAMPGVAHGAPDVRCPRRAGSAGVLPLIGQRKRQPANHPGNASGNSTLLLTAEKKFWRCTENCELPRLFVAEPPTAPTPDVGPTRYESQTHDVGGMLTINAL
jgi:hypothetical protein